MAMKRRGFLGLALGTVAWLAAPLFRLCEEAVPARYTEALRARFYPGPVGRLSKSETVKPGKWAG